MHASEKAAAGEAARAIARGLEHHRAGRLQAAESIYREVLGAVPGHPDALHLLGMVAFQNGQPRTAVDLVSRAIEVDPRNAEYRHDLGDVLQAEGDLDGAIARYEEALALDARHADASFGIGRALHRQGRLDDAARRYAHALAMRPGFAAACANLAMVLAQQGRLGEAIARYREAAALEPRSADILFNLGNALKDAGDHGAAAEAYRQAIALAPGNALAHNNLGAVLHETGSHAAAEGCYRQALALRPGYVDAASNLAALLDHMDRPGEAIAVLERAMAQQPGHAAGWLALGRRCEAQGRLREAGECYGRAVALAPHDADAKSDLARMLAVHGRLDAALALLREAVALAPQRADLHANLGVALLRAGEAAAALASLRAALALGESAEVRANVAATLQRVPLDPADAALRMLVARAMDEAWTRPAQLAAPAAALLRSDPAIATIVERGQAAWPGMRAAREVLGEDGVARLAGDPLLRALLQRAPLADAALERLCTLARHVLLQRACAGEEGDAPSLELACLLARQCFVNEYVFALHDEEDARVEGLRAGVDAALAAGGPIAPLALAILAAYRPLGTLAGATALAARELAAPLAGVVEQQVAGPARERALAHSLPALTPIADPTSQAVQRQYEANPYPRWVDVPAATGARTILGRLRERMPYAVLPQGPGPREPEVLVAGCGTGQEAIETALQWPRARVLGIDLSRASLAYAAREAAARKVRNLALAQADILAMPALGRQFDVISSVGVLHHLADPRRGLGALLACLRPGGFLQVGLYSARARAAVAAARAFVTRHGYDAQPRGIRAARQALLALPKDEPAAAVTEVPDFHSASACRDLLLHVQERAFTLAEIAAWLAVMPVRFVGFVIDPLVAEDYAQRNGAHDPAQTDLGRWEAYEAERPETFRGMYVFWLQKT